MRLRGPPLRRDWGRSKQWDLQESRGLYAGPGEGPASLPAGEGEGGEWPALAFCIEHTSVLCRGSRSSGYLEARGWWQRTVPYGSSGPLGIDGSAVAGMMAVVLSSILRGVSLVSSQRVH